MDTVFGLLAGGLLPIYDGIFDVEDRLRVIGGRHESALGYMADGYARACGRPPRCRGAATAATAAPPAHWPSAH